MQNCAVFGDFVYYDFKMELCAFDLGQTQTLLHQIQSLSQKYFCLLCVDYELNFQKPNFKSQKPLVIALVYAKKMKFEALKTKQIRYFPRFTQKLDRAKYAKDFEAVKNAIAKGQSYELNLTQELRLFTRLSSLTLFSHLSKAQNAEYKAFISHSYGEILSFSPELFFKKKGNFIEVSPMKGTIKRAKNAKKDKKNKEFLQNDEKNLSENVMIVDLLRNDLAKISKLHSLEVRELFAIKSYKSLHQMISTITANLKENVGLFEIFKALFPSGSITGAPKIETMKLISKLEQRQRGIYCGSIGLVHKDEALFNVAIRSLERAKNESEFRYGVGSGVVWDSKCKEELQELKLKSKFLKAKRAKNFHLFETMLYQNGRILFFKEHLQRLVNSANSLGFKSENLEIFKEILNKKRDFKALQNKSLEQVNTLLFKRENEFFDTIEPFEFDKNLAPNKTCILKMILEKNGKLHYEKHELKEPLNKTCFIYEKPIFTDDLSFHKTNLRANFAKIQKQWQKGLCYDGFCLNENGELTEGSRSNLLIKIDNALFTPPLNSGLLNGIYRQFLLDIKLVKEKNISKEDLQKAGAIYGVNSVRGAVKLDLRAENEL